MTTARKVPEWVGKTPDSKVPDHVKLRIWERDDGRCHITGRKIRPGDERHLDHIIPIKDGGRHAESNMAFALGKEHREKTAAEATERAVVHRKAKKDIGIKAKPKGRPMAGTKASGWKHRLDGTWEPR